MVAAREKVTVQQRTMHERVLSISCLHRKAGMDRVTPGLAVMMPNRDQQERGHSVAANVPTVEVTLKKWLTTYNKWIKLKAKRARTRAANTARATSVWLKYGDSPQER